MLNLLKAERNKYVFKLDLKLAKVPAFLIFKGNLFQILGAADVKDLSNPLKFSQSGTR